MDITFEVIDPTGKKVINDIRQEDGLHSIETGKGGDFSLCFDNRFSRMSSKVSILYLSIIFCILLYINYIGYFRPFSLKFFSNKIMVMIMTMITTGRRKPNLNQIQSKVLIFITNILNLLQA